MELASEWQLLLPPLAAGCLALLSHVPLGRQVLQRGIVFIDLAIAQVAGLGLLLAGAWWHAEDAAIGMAIGAAAAMLGALAVAWLSQLWPERREALIGLLYVGAASLATLSVSADPHGAQKLTSLLSGDVLWVTWTDLVPLAVATSLLLLLVGRWPELWQRSGFFYPAFALLVSLSLPLLGLYLVFATLIVPALVMLRRAQVAWSWGLGVGVLSYGLGLAMSWAFDSPSGPSVVLTLLLVGAAAMAWPQQVVALESEADKIAA